MPNFIFKNNIIEHLTPTNTPTSLNNLPITKYFSPDPLLDVNNTLLPTNAPNTISVVNTPVPRIRALPGQAWNYGNILYIVTLRRPYYTQSNTIIKDSVNYKGSISVVAECSNDPSVIAPKLDLSNIPDYNTEFIYDNSSNICTPSDEINSTIQTLTPNGQKQDWNLGNGVVTDSGISAIIKTNVYSIPSGVRLIDNSSPSYFNTFTDSDKLTLLNEIVNDYFTKNFTSANSRYNINNIQITSTGVDIASNGPMVSNIGNLQDSRNFYFYNNLEYAFNFNALSGTMQIFSLIITNYTLNNFNNYNNIRNNLTLSNKPNISNLTEFTNLISISKSTNNSTRPPNSIPTNIPINISTEIPTEIPTNIPTNISTEIPTNIPTQPNFSNYSDYDKYRLVYNILVDFKSKVNNFITDNSSIPSTIKNIEYIPSGANLYVSPYSMLTSKDNTINLFSSTPQNFIYNNEINYTVSFSGNNINSYNNKCTPTATSLSATTIPTVTSSCSNNAMLYILSISGNFYIDSLGNFNRDLYKSPYTYDNTNTKINSLDKINSWLLTVAPSDTSSEKSADVLIAESELLNSLTQINTSTENTTDIFDTLSTITTNQNTSVVVEAPPEIANIFINSPTIYPQLVDSTLPVTLATTIINSETGNQLLDVSKVNNDSIVVVPSFVEGSTIEMNNIQITRGTGDKSNLLFIGDSIYGIALGDPIIIGNQTFILKGIGSPVVFIVVANNKPVTVFDYLFMYSYFFAFLGAILFSATSIMSVDVASIFANKNVSVILNVYLGLTGLISLFVWYGVDLPIDIFNQNVVVTGVSINL